MMLQPHAGQDETHRESRKSDDEAAGKGGKAKEPETVHPWSLNQGRLEYSSPPLYSLLFFRPIFPPSSIHSSFLSKSAHFACLLISSNLFRLAFPPLLSNYLILKSLTRSDLSEQLTPVGLVPRPTLPASAKVESSTSNSSLH